jgi:hypothetical protein
MVRTGISGALYMNASQLNVELDEHNDLCQGEFWPATAKSCQSQRGHGRSVREEKAEAVFTCTYNHSLRASSSEHRERSRVEGSPESIKRCDFTESVPFGRAFQNSLGRIEWKVVMISALAHLFDEAK